GKCMASADRDGKIQVWQAKVGGTWELQRTIGIADHLVKGSTVGVALAPDGKYLAACSSDQAFVYVWSVAAETPAAKYQGREGESLRCLAFSPDGSVLAAGYHCTGKHGISVWDVATRQLRPPVHSDFTVAKIVFSPDGGRLGASFAEGVAIYDTSN